MCTTFLVNGTLSNGIVLGQFLPEFFHMTATRPGGIPPHRHVDFLAFSAPLMDCSCRELALCAQTVRREQSLCSKNLRKFLQMPVRWYPSQVSAGHAENSYVFINKTFRLIQAIVKLNFRTQLRPHVQLSPNKRHCQ